MSPSLLHSRRTRSNAAFGDELQSNLVAARTRIHTDARTHELRELFKANALWSTSDALLVDCALTGAASPGSTRWPSLPNAPIGTDDRTCKSNDPIDVFQKRIKGTLHCATVRRLNDSVSQTSPAGSSFVLRGENSRSGNEAAVGEAPVSIQEDSLQQPQHLPKGSGLFMRRSWKH